MISIFKCDLCGLCCRNLNKNDLYLNLHNGDGVCFYLNIEENLCTIYENRPDLCNIDLSYDKYFKDIYSLDEYYRLNYMSCEKLKAESR